MLDLLDPLGSKSLPFAEHPTPVWVEYPPPPPPRSYLAIIGPNSHEKLTKCEIRSSWSRFEHFSKSLVLAVGSHCWPLLAPIHMESWPNMKLGQVIIYHNVVIYHCCPYLPIFTPMYLCLHTKFSPYLVIVSSTCIYIYIYILLLRLHFCAQF